MELSLLLSTLPSGSCAKISQSFPTDIAAIQLFTKDHGRFLPHILYFGDAADLPGEYFGDAYLTFFVYGETPVPACFQRQNTNLILLTPEISPLLIYDQLHSQFSNVMGGFPVLGGQQSAGTLNGPLSQFLLGLLTTWNPQQHMIEHQAKHLRYKLLGRYHIIVIQPAQGTFSPSQFHLLADSLQTLSPGLLMTVYQYQLVLLLNLRRDQRIDDTILASLKERAVQKNLKVGISNPCFDLPEITRFYTQATRSILLGDTAPKHTASKPLYFYQEFSYGELFDICASQADLRNYIYPPLLELFNFDQKSDSCLMDTLFEYLQHNTNTQLTAESMFVHKNTILYRLNKIKEILQFDLTGGEDLFMITLSLRILIYLRIFIPKKIAGEYQAEEGEL